LEEQAEGPLVAPDEMGNKNHSVVIERLKKIPGYVEKFTQVFGKKDPINLKNLTQAIAAYERTLVTPNSRFDQFVKGDKKALSDIEKKGYETFQSVGCVTCHSGANFAGPTLPEGTGFFMKFPTVENTSYDKKYKFSADKGRYQVTKKEEDMYMFRVPTLRNVAYTAPYFHNGSVATLDEAVRVMGKTQLDIDLSKQQVSQIVAFLNTLNGSIPKQTMPQLPPTPNKTVVDTK
jgi:cytochrome c peroxidase